MSRRSSRLATNGYYQEEHSYHEGDGGGSSGGSVTASPGSVRYRENVARVFRARKTSHRGSGATPHGARGRAHVDSPLVTTERGNSIRVERGDGLSLNSTLIEESCLPERECSGYLWGLDKEDDQSTITLMMSEQTAQVSNESQRSLYHNTSTPAAAVAATDSHATRLWDKHSGTQHRASPAQHPPEPARSSSWRRAMGWVARPVNVCWTLVAQFTFYCVGAAITPPPVFGTVHGTADSKTTRKASTSANFFRRLVLKCMWVFGVGWYNLIGLLSLFNVFLLTRRIPRAIKMILLLILLLLAIVGVGYALVVFGYVHLSRSHEHAQAVPSDVQISSGTPSVVQVQSQHRLQQLEQQVSSLRHVVELQELKLAELQFVVKRHEQQGHVLEELRSTAEKQQHTIGDLKKLAEGHEHKRLASSVEVLEENVSKLMYEILHGHQQKVEAAVVATLGALASRGGDDGSELALFTAWLTARVLSSDHMRTLLRETEQAVVADVSKRWTWPPEPERDGALQSTGGGVSRQEVYAIVQSALRLYEEDKIGKFDFALESAGGTVISVRCSEAYSQQIALITLFGVPLWYTSQSPRVIIQPDVYPGDCWAFKGSRGYVAIKLSDTIYPSDFTLEHIPRALSPTGDITSAPKDFAVYGLDEEIQQEGYLLGQYMYDKHGDPLQTFHMSNSTAHPFGIVELRILSNWGNSEYTCIYRFRVHGELATSRG